MRDNIYIEKSLKRYIKSKKIGYSISLLVSFLITGSIMYGQELSSSQLKAKIAENNQRIEEIEKRIMELIKEGDYYAKTLEDNNQYFFPLDIEHRHSRGHQHFAVSNTQGPMFPIFPSKPDLNPEIPDIIEGGKPETPNAPDGIPVPPSDKPIEIEGIGKIEVKIPELALNEKKPTVNFDRNHITEIDKDLGIIEVPKVNVDENNFTEINMGQYGGVVNTPEKHYSYDPTYAKNPDIFKVNDIERPKDIILADIKINTEASPQGAAGIIRDKGYYRPTDGAYILNQTIIENYKEYNVKDGETLKITFEDTKDANTISYGNNKEELKKFELGTLVGDKVNLKDRNDLVEKFRNSYTRGTDEKTAVFISNTMSQDSTIDGKYHLDYKATKYNENVTRVFLSFNPAGLGGNTYNNYGDKDGGRVGIEDSNKDLIKPKGATNDFKGELLLTNKTEFGAVAGLDHQLWDEYLKKEKDSDPQATDHENYASSKDQLEWYSILKNTGTINLGNADGQDRNLIGIMIEEERETSALQKLNNNVTLNDGVININGQSSLGISYEYGWGVYSGTRNLNTHIGVVLSDDLYVGNINLNSNSNGNYGVRLQNVHYIADKNAYINDSLFDTPEKKKKRQETYEKWVAFTNRHLYDNTRVFGSLKDNQGNEKENIKDLKEKDATKVKKIALSGTNNAGFVVAKSLSDGAERYLDGTKQENIDANKNNIRDEHTLDDVNKDLEKKGENKIDINTSYIGKFNKDLGENFAGFDYGKVNPIANIHGLNIEVNGSHSVGFLRYKDYSNNNKNDMIITNDKTGAIKEIDFGKDAQSSVLIRSDMYGINVEKDLEIKGEGTTGEKAQDMIDTGIVQNPGKNIVLQATKSIWEKTTKTLDKATGKVEIETKNVKSVGHIINSGIMRSSQDNIIGMMASTAKPEEFAEKENNAEKLDKDYNKENAEIINTNTIELTGKNVIGMAVLDGNEGFLDNGKVSTTTTELPGTVAENQEITDYNVSIYNNGNFNIMNSTIETSGKGSIALYNNEGNIELRTDRSVDGKNEIKATNGAIGIYSKGGTITSNGNLNVTTDTGIGVYAIVKEDSTNDATKNANINLSGATITVGDIDNNGEAGLVAIGKEKVNPNTKDVVAPGNTTINFENSTLNYTGRGFALFTQGNGKIKIKDSTINLDGQAFGMNVELGATDKPITFEGDNNNIHVKSNDVTIFNIVSKDNKFSSNLSNLQDKIGEALGNNKQLLGKITAADGVTSYKTAIVDGGTLTIDKDISKSDIKEGNTAGYFYFKRFLGQRLNTTVNKDVIIDATVTGQDSKDYYNGKATGLEIVSSKNAKSVGETSLTLKTGSSVIANRINILDGEKAEEKNTVGVFSDYANITMEDGSSIIVEKKDDKNTNDKSFNGVGIFAVNGSNIVVGGKDSQAPKKAEISVHGDNAVGIYAKAYRSEIKDGKEIIVKDEYGKEAKGQGKINIENNGIIDVSNGVGTVGIYANNNNDSPDTGTSNSKVVNNGTIKTGITSNTVSSTGIHGIKTEISNNGVIEVAHGSEIDGKNYGSVGIKATKGSVVKNIGTIKLGKNSMGMIVDDTSKIELNKNETVKFEEVAKNNPTTRGKVDNEAINKVGIAYNNSSDLRNIRKHDFNIDATNVTEINAIASRGGNLEISKESNINISDNHSVGVIVESSTDGKRAEVHNNGTINIEKSKPNVEKGGISVGMLAINKNGHIYNEGTINLNGDDSVGLYISNNNNTKENANTIEKIGTININGKNNKGVYVASSKADGIVSQEDLKGINFGQKAESSTGIYVKGSTIKLSLGATLEKSLGAKDKGNVFIRGDENTTITNEGHLIIKNDEAPSSQVLYNNGVNRNIGILLDETSSYQGKEYNNKLGTLEVKNGAIGIYSKVGSKDKIISNLKMTVDSQDEETIGLAIKGNDENSRAILKTIYGNTSINLKNTNSKNTEESSKKAIGIAARDVKLVLGKLNLNYDSNNGIGIYLKDNASISEGEISITGTGLSVGKDTPYSIGVYVNDKASSSMKTNIKIEKDNSIGIYNNKENLEYNGKFGTQGIEIKANNSIGIYTNKNLVFKSGNISIKGGTNPGEASAGIYSDGEKEKLNNIVLDNAGITVNNNRDAGIFAKYSNITNKGKILVNKGIGVVLKGENSIFNGYSLIGGKITANSQSEDVETAIYLIDGAKLGNGTGKLELGKNDIGIYGENTIVDGSSFDKKLKDKEGRGKIDLSSSGDGIKGIVVDGKTTVSNLDLVFGESKNIMGIVALDNNTSIDNVKITSNSTNANTTGIYLSNKDGSEGNFNINKAEINLKEGYGILTTDIENSKDSKTVNLSNTTIRVKDSTDKRDIKGKGIYLGKNNHLNSNKNIFTIEDGVAIYGQENSNINLTETFVNLKGESTGIYSKGGKVTLDKNTTIGNVNTKKNVKGHGAVFVENGDIENHASIIGESDTFYGLFIDSSNEKKQSTIKNSGTITLTGNDNIAIALKGKGKDNTIENSGNIRIQEFDVELPIDENSNIENKKGQRSIGIFGENANINNTGNMQIAGKAIGIASINAEEGYSLNSTGNITLLGKEGIGVYLEGKGSGATVKDVFGDSTSSRSIGVALKNYESKDKNSVNIGKIELNNESLGLYVENKAPENQNEPSKILKENTINVDSIIVGTTDGKENQSVGVIIDDTMGSTTKLNIKEKISAGVNGTAIFNKGGNVNINAIEKLEVGKGTGSLVHSNGGNITFDTQSTGDKLTIDVKGTNGFILGNGATVSATEELKKKDLTLKVSEGGTGVVFTEHEKIDDKDVFKPTMDLDVETILVQGDEKKDTKTNSNKYTRGVYFNNLGSIIENFGTNLKQVGANTVGVVVRKTYGELKTNIDLTDKAYNSVGMVISDNGSNSTKITGNVSVSGDRNIGIEVNNSSLKTIGDVKVGEGNSFKNSYPIGIFATNNTEKQLNYTGEGNLNIANSGTGILAKNYNIDYTGTITAGVGAVGIFAENGEYSKGNHINVTGGLTLGDNSRPDLEKSAGIYGKDTDITFNAKDGMNLLSNKRNTGILSIGEGDVTYTGNVNIAGVYKDKDFDKGLSSSKGIYKYGTGNITVNTGDWTIGSNSIGIVANSEVKDDNGNITEEKGITINNSANMTVGKNSLGIYSVGNNTLTNTGNITVSGADDKDSSVGIYMGNSKEGEANKSVGTNKGTITVDGKNAVGVQAVGNVEFHNKGKIEVKNSGIGVFATNKAKIYNDKEGIIDLNGGAGDTHSIGMFAKGEGSSIINDGTINANYGVGMYVEDGATLTNNKGGVINVKNGVGIKGNGYLTNAGHINIENGYFGTSIDREGKENTSVNETIYIKDDITHIGSHYTGIGGTIDSKLDMILENPVIDITTGKGLGFKAPNIKGGIALAPNFPSSGNGFKYEIKDFIGENTDINVGTSPLFDSKFEGKDLIVNKVDYKDVMKDYKYETFYNSLDNTLRDGIASDIDAIKQMNSYLESFGQTGNFYEEYARTMGEVRGSIYSNVQSRMFDINRSFDNSFDEMEQSYNLSKDTDKYSVIYTGGDYKSGKVEIPDYKYNIMGLQYMKEFEDVNYDNKYGYTFGFTGSRFKFRDNGRSKENIYSLKGGVHNVKSFNKDLDLLTKLDVGLNYHDMTRKLAFGPVSYKNDSDYYSYYVGFDNKFRKTIFKNYQNEFGAYAGAELEYGRFTNIKENGTLALKVKSNDYYIAKGMAGFSGTGRKYLGNDWTAKITGDVGYSYDFAKYDENKVKLRKSNSGYTSILDEVDSKGKVTGKIGIGFERLNHLGVTLEGEVSRDIARDEDYWRVGLRFNYKFNQEDAVTTLRNVFHLMDNHFDFDKDNLKPREQKIVAAGSKIIDTYNLKGTLRLEGHTDSCGSVEYNQGLSERRAETVKREFIKDIKKSENIKYETQGYSELRPVDTNKTKEGRANNRRVEVKFIEK
ncbi:OmpA family protein [Fusobacterium sp. SYSU M8D902]|uniref:autotransporter domain-containing protein n=1 Tax=Fusobacterium sp. SYSU M8D902 TaxID=3159562 RepID=UPI0032E430D5